MPTISITMSKKSTTMRYIAIGEIIAGCKLSSHIGVRNIAMPTANVIAIAALGQRFTAIFRTLVALMNGISGVDQDQRAAA